MFSAKIMALVFFVAAVLVSVVVGCLLAMKEGKNENVQSQDLTDQEMSDYILPTYTGGYLFIPWHHKIF